MCSRENCRHVEIGDLIVEHGTDFIQDQRWYGIVVGPVKGRKFPDRVEIVWTSDNPNYTEKYGYNTTNLHNLRRKYDIYKIKETYETGRSLQVARPRSSHSFRESGHSSVSYTHLTLPTPPYV